MTIPNEELDPKALPHPVEASLGDWRIGDLLVYVDEQVDINIGYLEQEVRDWQERPRPWAEVRVEAIALLGNYFFDEVAEYGRRLSDRAEAGKEALASLRRAVRAQDRVEYLNWTVEERHRQVGEP